MDERDVVWGVIDKMVECCFLKVVFEELVDKVVEMFGVYDFFVKEEVVYVGEGDFGVDGSEH